MFGDVLENLSPQDLRPFGRLDQLDATDRKSTRLNSSHWE